MAALSLQRECFVFHYYFLKCVYVYELVPMTVHTQMQAVGTTKNEIWEPNSDPLQEQYQRLTEHHSCGGSRL